MRARRAPKKSALVCLLGILGAWLGGVGVAGRAPPAAAAVQPCSSGLVALTFDDGPSSDVTPRLLELLSDQRVPATFFMVGGRVAAARSIALAAYEQGFVIANHTYAHESLPSLSDDGIRATLRRTADALRAAGVTPSTLMRPPYGATDSRVDSVVKGVGLTPVLWDVDPRNWNSGSASDITARVLSALRPGGRNIVLLHDGVARSDITLAAVPGIISGARARGYCFAELGSSGDPVPPVPELRVSDAHAKEADPGTGVRLTFTLALDRPTSRAVSVRVRSDAGSATEDVDYRRLAGRVEIPSGTTSREVTVWVRGDRVDEGRERLRLRLDEPRGLTVEDRVGVATIFDDDPRPRVRLADATVLEPATGSVVATVRITMDRPRSRKVVLTMSTVPGTADEEDYVPLDTRVVLPAGDLRASVAVTVVADVVEEVEETFEVRVLSADGARVADGTAVVTITQPEPPEPPEPPEE